MERDKCTIGLYSSLVQKNCTAVLKDCTVVLYYCTRGLQYAAVLCCTAYTTTKAATRQVPR